MDAKLLKAITDLTAAIDRNTKQIERSDPNSYVNRISRQIRSSFENPSQNQEQDQKSTD
tara:strand:- start:276 stop:452 length:177 start_codon:yes stop_codon:yes gene_type:complete